MNHISKSDPIRTLPHFFRNHHLVPHSSKSFPTRTLYRSDSGVPLYPQHHRPPYYPFPPRSVVPLLSFGFHSTSFPLRSSTSFPLRSSCFIV
jgi:hypothetical protein